LYNNCAIVQYYNLKNIVEKMMASSEYAMESAAQVLLKKQSESTVFSEEAENAVPKFHPHGKFTEKKKNRLARMTRHDICLALLCEFYVSCVDHCSAH
jgi:hypothetical protein